MPGAVPRPSDLRSRRLATGLERLWSRGLLPRPDLDAVASRAAALDAAQAFGQVSPWRASLERLLESLRNEADLNPIGLTFAYVQLNGLLKQRERAAVLWHHHPEILELPLADPVVVLGQMRSGTTRLQRLLGCDRRFHHPRFFEVMGPIPSRPDWRILESRAQLGALTWLNPELAAIHPSSATSVEEVFGLLSFSFYGAQLEAQWRVPGFARYWEEQDRGWIYGEFRQLLQTLAWQRGGRSRPWVLKAPQFMEDLEPLLEVFPGARLVCLNRDPAQVVGSSASLVWNQMKLQSDSVDPHWVGAEWLHKTGRRERLAGAVRRARPEVPQIDVAFEAMNEDWRREMRQIYAFLGIELTPALERQMEAYSREAERSGFRGHRYRLEDFGLSASLVRATLCQTDQMHPQSADQQPDRVT